MEYVMLYIKINKKKGTSLQGPVLIETVGIQSNIKFVVYKLDLLFPANVHV